MALVGFDYRSLFAFVYFGLVVAEAVAVSGAVVVIVLAIVVASVVVRIVLCHSFALALNVAAAPIGVAFVRANRFEVLAVRRSLVDRCSQMNLPEHLLNGYEARHHLRQSVLFHKLARAIVLNHH